VRYGAQAVASARTNAILAIAPTPSRKVGVSPISMRNPKPATNSVSKPVRASETIDPGVANA